MKTAQTALIFLAAVLGAASPASAQKAVNKTVKVEAGKETQIGVFGRVRPDCSTGPVRIEVITPPLQGVLNARRGQLAAGAFPSCPDTVVPVAIFFYRSLEDYSGADAFIIELTTDAGQRERHNFSVTVR